MVYRFIEFYALFSRLLLGTRLRGTTGTVLLGFRNRFVNNLNFVFDATFISYIACTLFMCITMLIYMIVAISRSLVPPK